MPASGSRGRNEGSEPIAARRRQQIVDAAVLLFSERGYYRTTIEDISREINVGKGLIYRYFEDKSDVLFSAICAVLDEYHRADVAEIQKAAGPLSALIRLLAMHCSIAEEHTRETVLAYRSTKDLNPDQRRQIKDLELGIVRQFRRYLSACVHEKLMIAQVDTDVMAYGYVMFGHTWALKNWALRDIVSSAEYVSQGEQLLIYPFLSDAGKVEFARLKEVAGFKVGPVAAQEQSGCPA